MNREEARRKLVESYITTGSISGAARLWHTSRNVVIKWVRRYQEEGLFGLGDWSRRPHHSPNRTKEDLEEKVLQARQKTVYGKKRLAWYLEKERVQISV